MASFRVTDSDESSNARRGVLDVPHGPVETPAMFPVLNLIGGSTIESGGVWRYMRDGVIDKEHLQGVMFQAMSFTDYNLTPSHLENWRQRTFHEWFDALDAPVFVDSGGFKLMNSETFGDAPQEGGRENEWGLYTNPESILGLQVDYGADIIATLDYPIPPKLKEAEKQDRMERSIESAVRCLQLLESPEELQSNGSIDDRTIERLQRIKREGNDPGVFVAIHGYDYETINWYVAEFLNRIEQEDVSQPFQGFAVGSLVPFRTQHDLLVDIIQGAKDAIPESRTDEIALHVFGVGGKLAPLLGLLGVDSYDSSSHVQAAMYKKYVVPETWENLDTGELVEHTDSTEFPCSIPTCPLCTGENDEGITTPVELYDRLEEESTYEKRQRGRLKSPVYALVARHNFEVYNQEMQRVRQAIENDRLINHAVEMARKHDDIKRALKYAQVRDTELRAQLEARNFYELLPGPDVARDQAKLAQFGAGVEDTSARRISLERAPGDFDITMQDYNPPTDRTILLLIPCSQKKPYGESRTHRAVLSRLDDSRDNIHKVTLSGMYGPVPEEKESVDAVLKYDYVLAGEDEAQVELVTDRLIKYLETHGDSYDTIVAYAVSTNYRDVIENALETYGRGDVLPRDPRALQLTEHFRTSNIEELVDYVEDAL